MASIRPAGLRNLGQNLGRSLMLPIAVLPVAGLLLRLGQDDIAGPVAALLPFLHLGFLATAGNAIFDNLGLLFAIGVAIGFARENHGAAGLAGVIGYLVATEGAAAMVAVPASETATLPAAAAKLIAAHFQSHAIHDLSVPIGILCGVAAGAAYNRFHTIRLPDYLAFFGGRRFVPIVMGLFGVLLAMVVGASYGALHAGITGLGEVVVQGGGWGLFAYGVLNRLLIVTGLHHILNNIAWFIIGDYHGSTGDLRRFFAGDPAAGGFMAGFFPIMMFGLPAACLAMYHTARPRRRKEVAGMLLSQGLTSFLTGVTEPVEFSFMFLAPALYALHMVLTGLAFVILRALDVKLGFSFSAGLVDYVINFHLATHPMRMLPVGLGFAAVYYGVFRFAILRFDLKTPGREEDDARGPISAQSEAGDSAGRWLAALGGRYNIKQMGACTTRLRLLVADGALLDEAALRRLGAMGIVRGREGAVQVIVGPVADRLCGELRGAIAHGGAGAEHPIDIARLIAALGGRANITHAIARSTRVVVTTKDIGAVDCIGAEQAGMHACVPTDKGRIHLLAGSAALDVCGALDAHAV